MLGLSEQEILEIGELAEAHANADMIAAMPASLAAALGVHDAWIGGAYALAVSELDGVLFNRVIGLGVTQPATVAMLDRIRALFTVAGTSATIQLAPQARPAALADRLAARGFAPTGAWAKFLRGPEPPPLAPTDLRVKQIGPEHAAAAARICGDAFHLTPPVAAWLVAGVGRPGWHHYLAFAGDEPVAVAMLYVRDGIGWFGSAGTLPAYRGQGGQSALLARRITDAAAAGCRWLVVETGEDTPQRPNPSYHNIVRAGFTRVYLRPNWRRLPRAE